MAEQKSMNAIHTTSIVRSPQRPTASMITPGMLSAEEKVQQSSQQQEQPVMVPMPHHHLLGPGLVAPSSEHVQAMEATMSRVFYGIGLPLENHKAMRMALLMNLVEYVQQRQYNHHQHAGYVVEPVRSIDPRYRLPARL